MATFTISSCADTFPVGTSVGAYLARYRINGSSPSGSATATASVASNGSLAFTGLADDTEYVAYASVGGVHKYRSFQTSRPRYTGQEIVGPLSDGYAPVWSDSDDALVATPVVSRSRTGATDTRILSDTSSTYSADFDYSLIATNQDGHFVWKNLTVNAGYGPQAGLSEDPLDISYFKGVGGNVIHNGKGNIDVFWTSLAHHGVREAGLFIGDVTGDWGGNLYGGHVRVTAETTAPDFMVGWDVEIIPDVAKDVGTTTRTLSTTIPANTEVEQIVVGSSIQLTQGTNLSMTAADASTKVAYVAEDMGAASTTIPVLPFESTSAINSGGTVTVGVSSSYFGMTIFNNGSETASAALFVDGPDGTATTPFAYGINLGANAGSSGGTGILINNAWGTGIDMDATPLVGIGTLAGDGSSPNREIRLADHIQLDNARYIRFKDSGGTTRNAISATSANALRFITPQSSGTAFEFYSQGEAGSLASITTSGRGNFSSGGITTKYASQSLNPAFVTNGQVEVWHDTDDGKVYLLADANGARYKVEMTAV